MYYKDGEENRTADPEERRKKAIVK